MPNRAFRQAVGRFGQDRRRPWHRREQRVSEGVDQDVAAGQAELRQEPLHPLARVADQGAAGDPFGRSRVGRDAEQPWPNGQSATVEDRSPVVPEQAAVRGVRGLPAGGRRSPSVGRGRTRPCVVSSGWRSSSGPGRRQQNGAERSRSRCSSSRSSRVIAYGMPVIPRSSIGMPSPAADRMARRIAMVKPTPAGNGSNRWSVPVSASRSWSGPHVGPAGAGRLADADQRADAVVDPAGREQVAGGVGVRVDDRDGPAGIAAAGRCTTRVGQRQRLGVLLAGGDRVLQRLGSRPPAPAG